MEANKKKSGSFSEKSTSAESGGTKKDKKEDGTKVEDRGRQKQKLAVFVEEPQGRKTLQNMKAITTQGFARASGVKISVANSYIKSLESKGVIMSIGGYSGHKVYRLIT
jgi:small subunit ribosomal protein S25e